MQLVGNDAAETYCREVSFRAFEHSGIAVFEVAARCSSALRGIDYNSLVNALTHLIENLALDPYLAGREHAVDDEFIVGEQHLPVLVWMRVPFSPDGPGDGPDGPGDGEAIPLELFPMSMAA